MRVSFYTFLPFYLAFLALGATDRIFSTFFGAHKKSYQQRYYRFSFFLPFASYLLIVILSAGEYLFTVSCVHVGVSMGGLGLFACGVFLRRRAIATLGDNWSVFVEIKNDHRLVTKGIYSRFKHPYCLAVVCELAGICLVANAYFSLRFVYLIQVPLLIMRVILEEGVLIKHFGKEYIRYRKGKLF